MPIEGCGVLWFTEHFDHCRQLQRDTYTDRPKNKAKHWLHCYVGCLQVSWPEMACVQFLDFSALTGTQ